MYLLWKRTKNGNLLLDKEGLKNFIASTLPSGYECLDVGLLPDTDEVFTSIAMPDIHSDMEMELIEAKIKESFASTGLTPRIAWGVKDCVSVSFWGYIGKKARPVAMGLVAAGVVGVYCLGPVGILSAVVSGVVVAGLVYFLVDPSGRRNLKSMKERYWR